MTDHLTPEQFVDVADRERAEASLPHLAECRACRDELSAMRASMAAAIAADVPEPPPFFWDRLSTQVRDRLDRESTPRAWWSAWRLRRSPAFDPLLPIAAVAIIVTILVPGIRVRQNETAVVSNSPGLTGAGPRSAEQIADVGDFDDPLLTLVADLSSNMDWDAAADAGFSELDGAEHAVTHMSHDELRALRELLQQEIGRPGA